jgi:hypothetical protein
VLFIVHTRDLVCEVVGTLPVGSFGVVTLIEPGRWTVPPGRR